MNRLISLSACAVFLLPCAATAQDKSSAAAPIVVSHTPETPKDEYIFKFIAKEVEGGRVINTREYMLHSRAGVNSSDSAQIKTGSRVPVAIGSYGSGSQTQNTQYSYIDVGINFECSRIELSGNRVTMAVKGEISSYDQSASNAQPVVRQNRWDGSVTVPIGKTETIFSSDDVVSKRTLQVDLQVTPVR